MIDIVSHIERCYVACAEDQLQAGHRMAIQDLRYPLADPQVDQQMFQCLNEQCNHCGSCFSIEEHMGGCL
jgi:NAD-dependent dihydropyrimidine dehydrogenase PreA subunit